MAKKAAHTDIEDKAKVSRELFDPRIIKMGGFIKGSGVYSFRLLLMVAQQANQLGIEQPKGETAWEFGIKTVYQYLGLSSEDYKSVKSILKKFVTTAVEVKDDEKAFEYEVFAICKHAKLSGDKVLLELTDGAIPYLSKLSSYAMLKPSNALRLDSPYKQLIYAYLRGLVNPSKAMESDVSIADLLKYFGLDGNKAYTTSKDAKRDFCKRILGIARPKGWKWNPVGKSAPWSYVTDKEGKPFGTLYSINEYTDLHCEAYAYDYCGEPTIHFAVKEVKRVKLAKDAAKSRAEDEFDIWLRLVGSTGNGYYNGIEIPAQIVFDQARLQLYCWYLTAPADEVDAVVMPLMGQWFSFIENGGDLTSTALNSGIQKHIGDGRLHLMPFPAWRAITRLYRLRETYPDKQVFDPDEAVRILRRTKDGMDWEKLRMRCEEAENPSKPIRNVTAYVSSQK